MDFSPVPGGRMFGVMIKHPLSEVMVYVNWADFLDTLQTTALSSEWVDPNSSPLVLTGPMFSARQASVEIGGGIADGTYIIENRVDMADGGRGVFRLSVFCNGALI